jgi:hypothetical protein
MDSKFLLFFMLSLHTRNKLHENQHNARTCIEVGFSVVIVAQNIINKAWPFFQQAFLDVGDGRGMG